MKRHYLIASMVCVMLCGAGCAAQKDAGDGGVEETGEPQEELIQDSMEMTTGFPGISTEEERTGKQIRITTQKGDMTFELYGETAPKAVSNFIALTNKGYYNGLTFHRREEGFVIQGGDPNGNGTGGPGYTFEDELDDEYTYERGVVAMANRGADTNGSQFFIMLESNPLPKLYTIFGRVTEGMDVVDEIAIGDVMTAVTVEDLEATTESEE